MQNNNKFLVHIQCMTYNHESYIEDAMAGFVMQDTNFPFVAVIIDDASNDKTEETVLRFMADHFIMNDPEVSRIEEKDYGQLLFAQHLTNKNCYFAVILLNENHYQSKRSKKDYYEEWSNTKYTALCEGDDYWTDPYKLQKQVDYMESHLDCGLCVHRADWEVDGVLKPMGCQSKESFDLSLEESIRNGGLYIATASFLYRQEIAQEWPKWRAIAHIGDFPLQLLCGLKGKVHFLADTMCVYRFRCKGSWSDRHRVPTIGYSKNEVQWMEEFDRSTNYEYSAIIHGFLFKQYQNLFMNREISLAEYWRCARKSGSIGWKRIVKDYIKRQFHID